MPQNIPGGEIYRPWKRHDRRRRVGRTVYDDQKLGFNKVAPVYHYPGWWKAARSWTSSSTKAFNALSPENKAIVEAPRRLPTRKCRPATTPATLRAEATGGAKA